MKKIVLYLIVASILFGANNEKRDRVSSVRKAIDGITKERERETKNTNTLKDIFEKGKVSGELRSEYINLYQKQSSEANTYATAIGGFLKFETASFKGFSVAASMITSQDINSLTGNNDKQNNELSSTKGNYTELDEAYIEYKYGGFNFKAGRQMLDTPLADSDDIRMIKNTFEAYMLSYKFDNFEFIAGNIQRWQGYDANLDDGWSKVGKYGAYFGGIKYDGVVSFNGWYYNITSGMDGIYIDLESDYKFNNNISFHGGVQYLWEQELEKSTYEASIYGAMAELVVYDIGFNLAFNKSDKKKGKQSFSGIGGGSMYSSMDTMIIDEISQDRDVLAIVGGISYDFYGFNLIYAYGDFNGEKNSLGKKEHIVEQDVSLEYSFDEKWTFAGIYVMQEDKEHKEKTEHDWNRFLFIAKYGF